MTDPQRSISIKIPDLVLTVIDNLVRIGLYDSRSDFLRKAIEDIINSEFGKWETLVDELCKK